MKNWFKSKEKARKPAIFEVGYTVLFKDKSNFKYRNECSDITSLKSELKKIRSEIRKLTDLLNNKKDDDFVYWNGCGFKKSDFDKCGDFHNYEGMLEWED